MKSLAVIALWHHGQVFQAIGLANSTASALALSRSASTSPATFRQRSIMVWVRVSIPFNSGWMLRRNLTGLPG